jgi:hypothetical protein
MLKKSIRPGTLYGNMQIALALYKKFANAGN